MSLCHHPRALDLFPYRRVDYVEMARAAAEELYKALHDERPYHDGTFTHWAEERSASHPYHFSDGVTVHVAEVDVMPWDLFTTQTNASPVRPDQDE